MRRWPGLHGGNGVAHHPRGVGLARRFVALDGAGNQKDMSMDRKMPAAGTTSGQPDWMDSARQQLHHLLLHLAPLPLTEWQWLNAQLSPAVLLRGEHLCEAGKRPTALHFLINGVVRFYYLTEDGREFNKAFARAGELVGPLVALATGEPCTYFVQALTDCQSLRIPCELVPAIYDRHGCWDRIGRRLAEQTSLRKEQREKEFLLTSAKARYEAFRARYPGLQQQIPQKHIASYIGITEVALSRLLHSSS